MYTNGEKTAELERDLGSPMVTDMSFEIKPWEADMVTGSQRDGRAHDVTLFIRRREDPGQIAVIRKPFFPIDAFRAPSGAARRGEPLLDGGVREALEETGLHIEPTRYLVRINASFTTGGDAIEWTSHILDAVEVGGTLDPIDTVEIAEARWATVDEIQGPIRQVLLDTGWDLFRYRVALTDLAIEALTGSGARTEAG